MEIRPRKPGHPSTEDLSYLALARLREDDQAIAFQLPHIADHVAKCEYCMQEVYDLEDLLVGGEEDGSVEEPDVAEKV